MIEHGAILTTGETLRVPLLDDAAPVEARGADAGRLRARADPAGARERARWHIKGPKGAAAALGLNPSTLYNRMKKLGIQPSGPAEDGSEWEKDQIRSTGTARGPSCPPPVLAAGLRQGPLHLIRQ